MTASAPQAANPDSPLHFVLNGASGSQNDTELLATIAKVLDAAQRRYVVHHANRPDELPAVARRAAAQAGEGGTVVAVGGDGTVNTVASVVIGSRNVMGLLPRGTFNYTARVHGIPLDAAEALRLLLTGEARAVQAGRLNDRLFLVNASLGLYPGLLEDREAFKRRFGRSRLVAMGAALHSLLRVHQRMTLHIEADDTAPHELKVSTLFVGNNRLQIEALGLPEADRTGHGHLVALALRALRPGELLWLAARGVFGRLADADKLTHFAFERLSVRPRLPLPRRWLKVAMDGEVLRLRPPLVFGVDERPLWLIKPAPVQAAQP